MKHQSVKRLMLKKQTVVHLNNGIMKRVKGGEESVYTAHWTCTCMVPDDDDTFTCVCPLPTDGCPVLTDDENTCVTCQVPISG